MGTKARDVAWGRRGGRWHDGETKVEDALEAIHRQRLRLVARGEWPAESLKTWEALAAQADEHLAAGRPIDRLLEKAIETWQAHLRFVAGGAQRAEPDDELDIAGPAAKAAAAPPRSLVVVERLFDDTPGVCGCGAALPDVGHPVDYAGRWSVKRAVAS